MHACQSDPRQRGNRYALAAALRRPCSPHTSALHCARGGTAAEFPLPIRHPAPGLSPDGIRTPCSENGQYGDQPQILTAKRVHTNASLVLV